MADTALPDALIVLLDGRIAGTLTRAATAGSYTFTYDENWQRDPSAFPLSLSIPLSSRTHDGPRVSYYLRGLLPDNESRLSALAAEFKVDPDDPYALLSHVGEDCPGAVQFARPDRLSTIGCRLDRDDVRPPRLPRCGRLAKVERKRQCLRKWEA